LGFTLPEILNLLMLHDFEQHMISCRFSALRTWDSFLSNLSPHEGQVNSARRFLASP